MIRKLLRRVARQPEVHRGSTSAVLYKVGSHNISLPSDHMLPNYQKQHKLYDRYLPLLVASLPTSDRLIIDIGANVGDTSIACIDKCNHKFICVEGFEPYVDALRHNVEAIVRKPDRFTIINAMVGTPKTVGVLASNGSSATLVNQVDGLQATELDEIARNYNFTDAVALLKIDTDGFDGDVILSAKELIKKSKPLIFFENEIKNKEQKLFFETAYSFLESVGYKNFLIFDNFGNLILDNARVCDIISINNYVACQNDKSSTRTMFYTDILAYHQEDIASVNESLNKYRHLMLSSRLSDAAS